MRICFLTERLLKGYGVDLVVHNQATLLSEKGHEILVLTPRHDAEYYKDTVYKIKVFPYDYKNTVKYISLIKKGEFDCVVAHTPEFYFLLPILNKYAKTVVYEHGTPTPSLFPENIKKYLTRMIGNKRKYVYPNVDAIFTNSNFVKEDIGFDSKDKKTIYIGADHFFKGTESVKKDFLSSKGNKIKILTVCRLGGAESNYKGLNTFKEFACHIRDKNDKYEFFVAGKGNETDKKLLEQKGFNVILNPTDEELQACYNSCDAFVHFSKWEGFNLPLAEAEWCKKPAFAIANGAHPEVTPFTFDNYKEIADFLLEKNGEDLRDLGEKCFLHVQKFTWENNVNELEHALIGIKAKENRSVKFSYFVFFVMHCFIRPAGRRIIRNLVGREALKS